MSKKEYFGCANVLEKKFIAMDIPSDYCQWPIDNQRLKISIKLGHLHNKDVARY